MTQETEHVEPTEEQLHAAEELAHGIEKDLGLPEGSMKVDPTTLVDAKPQEVVPLEGMEMSEEEQREAQRALINSLPGISLKQAGEMTESGVFDTSLANTTSIPEGTPTAQFTEGTTYSSNLVTQDSLESWIREKGEFSPEGLAQVLLASFKITKK